MTSPDRNRVATERLLIHKLLIVMEGSPVPELRQIVMAALRNRDKRLKEWQDDG